MATVTVAPPYNNADAQGTLGHSYVFAAEAIRLEIQDKLNMLALGVVPLVGDLAGSGSDTVRITDFGGIGFSTAMTAMASETDTVAPTPVDIGYESITVAPYGLGHAETYFSQIIGREDVVKVDGLRAYIGDSWLKTFRDQVCVAGAGMATDVGSASTTLSVDDHLDLLTAYRTTEGARRPTVVVDGQQYDELLRSYRTEPAFGGNTADFTSLLGLKTEADGSVMQVHRDFAGMGHDLVYTSSVQQSGGAYQGFAFSPGGIGWARASTAMARPANRNELILVPELGLLIEEITAGSAQRTREIQATAILGFALASTRTHVLRGFISTT